MVQIANCIAQRGLAPVAHVQRPGRVGRNKFDHHLLSAGGLAAKLDALSQHSRHHLLFGLRRQPDIDKPWPGDFQSLGPALVGLALKQLGAQGFGELAGVEFERLGQLHGGGGCEVAVGRHFGRLKNGLGPGPRAQRLQCLCQRIEQLLFDNLHGAILSGRPAAPVAAPASGPLPVARLGTEVFEKVDPKPHPQRCE